MGEDNYLNKTDEFSFVLKPSEYGIGVFATHNIKKDTYLRLFGGEKLNENKIRILEKKDVPEKFRDYCIERGDKITCPEDFGEMPVGWFLNHSQNFNAFCKSYEKPDNHKWFAYRNIKEGEEILVDYNVLGEPEDAKDNYYKN